MKKYKHTILVIILFMIGLIYTVALSAHNKYPKDPELIGSLMIMDERIIFVKNGYKVGELSWDLGKLRFEGTAEPPAEIFFHFVLKPHIDEYIYSLSEQELKTIQKQKGKR